MALMPPVPAVTHPDKQPEACSLVSRPITAAVQAITSATHGLPSRSGERDRVSSASSSLSLLLRLLLGLLVAEYTLSPRAAVDGACCGAVSRYAAMLPYYHGRALWLLEKPLVEQT